MTVQIMTCFFELKRNIVSCRYSRLRIFINASKSIMEYRRAGSGRFRLDNKSAHRFIHKGKRAALMHL